MADHLWRKLSEMAVLLACVHSECTQRCSALLTHYKKGAPLR
jgi:hypothetical protein